ncbi:MAG: hypothetical protein LBL58_07995, partial [Tannerellaceae bacterium]|nr:hypothetical protein [Tannerellaceae bacterium]
MKTKAILLIYLSFLLPSCHTKSSDKQGSEPADSTQSVQQKKEIPLPPLEGGEVFLKNKDVFGGLIELKGEQFIPDTFLFV